LLCRFYPFVQLCNTPSKTMADSKKRFNIKVRRSNNQFAMIVVEAFWSCQGRAADLGTDIT
jgi:hypothetical protein